MIARIRKAMDEKEEGFTLIELLVVIIIIGILAAIAIPVFLNQRQKGFNAAAKSDLRQLANIMESDFTDTQAYGDPATGATFRRSAGVMYAYKVSTDLNSFCLSTYNTKTLGTPPAVANAEVANVYVYDSANGGDAATTCAITGGAWSTWT